MISRSMRSRIRVARYGLVEVFLLAALAVCALSASASGRMYRFVNAEGKLEISSAIPNERVVHGYDVLDGSGRVIQRVSAELTPAELEEKKKKDAELEKCREVYRRVSAMYQTEADIDRFEDEAFEALETAIANDQANLLVVRGQHSEFLAQAARAERSGSTLSGILVQNIDRASAQIQLLERSIRKRERERSRIEARFRNEREVFRRGPC